MNKKRIGFIVDSAMGLFAEEIGYDNVRQVFFNITDSDNNQYLDNNESLKINDIIKKFESGKVFQTSAVSPGSVMATVEDMLDEYETVILLATSSGLSSFYDNVKFLEEEYKGKFFVVDTKEIGVALKDILDKAQEMEKNNESVESIIKFCSEAHKKNFTSFTCESWEHLSKSGRAPKLLSKVLSTIHTRPIINFYIKNRLGGIALGKGDKGFMKSFEKMIEFFKKTFNHVNANDIENIYLYNNIVKENRIEMVKNKISETFNIAKEKIKDNFAPNIVFVYTGIGSFGIYIKCKKEATDRE